MGRAQKRILAIGLLVMALAALFPPTYHMGERTGVNRGFLYSGYFDGPRSLNSEKLAVEWMFIAAMTGFLMMTAKGIANRCAGFRDDFRNAREDQKEKT